ncbi:MAG: hypothetical protein NTZ09_18750 [Candidatus Hydrogenedentes bacterium]|nr:hypothetical protein [Candidatus Hydrogenedentota bacterium]
MNVRLAATLILSALACPAVAADDVLSNPLLTEHPILFVSRPQYKPDHHNTETMFLVGEINTDSFEGGSALKMIHPRRGGAVTTLVEAPNGIVRDPDISFDARTILFSMRLDKSGDYHIYEINSDGSGLRQLTFAQGIADIDPIYLPDGDVAFSSTREPKYCMCNRHIMANLYRMGPDGANIHQIGKNPLFEGHASLLPDGRILYDRWEYVDRNFGSAQGLWTANPDGTSHLAYWGNNTHSPGAVLDARIVPGALQAICTFSSCHDRPWGAIALIDRRLGLDGRPGVVKTWPASAIDLVDHGDFDQFMKVQPKYEDPYPLNESYFLCSRMTGRGEQMGVYLLDLSGNETLVYAEKDEQLGSFDPMPLAPRPRPPVIPSRRTFEGTGEFFVADVYRGTHMAGVERGMVKWLRVVETPEKRTWTHPSWNGQGQEAPAMNWHDFNNKRILGTAPVEEDGSAYFTVPADAFVYFQLLDQNGMMVQSMRSGTTIQPGECQGCIGCHEARLESAPLAVAAPLRAAASPTPMALRRGPSALAGWYGPPRTFSYLAEVQPVFDKHCASCHDFGKRTGEKLLLCADKTLTFNVSYEDLWRKKYIKVVGAGPPEIVQAMSWGSHASPLAKEVLGKYKAGKLDKESFDRIVTWIDLNAPYYPEYSTGYPDNLAGRAPLTDSEVKRLAELTGVPFAAQADQAKSLGPTVTFDRPEKSPCLKRFDGHTGPQYKEAVAIIEAGNRRLKERPRGDTPGFTPCEADLAREEKYAARRKVELRNREAILRGEKVYDAGQATGSE